MNIRRATYDKEAKALYIYIIPKEERTKKSHHNNGLDLDDPAEGVNVDWCQGRNDAHCTVTGIEILNVELEDITHVEEAIENT